MFKKLEGKTAVITGGTEGIGLAAAKLFVKEGAYVFITGRRQKELDDAVKEIGTNVSGVQGDIAQLADLDRLYDTISRVKGRIDIVFANAGVGEFVPLGAVTAEYPAGESAICRRHGADCVHDPDGTHGGTRGSC
jgi:NAD(P)-dependent dehydrogenase (short-subunit alcohol dehydrogenase family)